MLAQFLELIFNLKPQLPEVFNIDLVFARAPVLRVGDTNLEFAQTGAIRFHGELHDQIKSAAAVASLT